MTGSASSEIRQDDVASMENYVMNEMFTASNDQNVESPKVANTSSENEVYINQLVIDIKKSIDSLHPNSDSSTKPCIYRVPRHLRKVNQKAYTPTLISIGPYHHTYRNEEFKLRYVERFTGRVHADLRELFITINDRKEHIRSCYSDLTGFDEDDDFVKMILVDAIFILELFLSCSPKTDESNQENHDSTDPIKAEPWRLPVVTLDLVLLENQLPFSIIKDLYDKAFFAKSETTPLNKLIFEFFKDFNVQNMKPEDFNIMNIKHFTDLLRNFYLHAPPTPSKSKRCNCFNWRTREPASRSITSNERPPRMEVRKLLYSATQLHEAGVKFEFTSKCLLDLDFDKSNGVLKIPGLELNDSAEARIRNVMAYEQFDLGEKIFITDYLIILDFLINTTKDMDLLCDEEIVVNYLGDNKVATSVVNKLNTNVSWLGIDSKYSNICKELNDFGKEPRNRWIAILRHEYFNTPWRGAATIAAFILLLLTLIQSVCSVYQVV